jgi:glutathione synthase/RimK-type ligase-like ATP-grasp enzyme
LPVFGVFPLEKKGIEDRNMKKIGILFGQERSFPLALVDRINRKAEDGRVVAEPVKVGGVSLEIPKPYDLILDRISQDIPFYRAILKKFAADGTVVVNNPFWWSADDKFFNNVLARSVNVAVPKTVILPSNQHPPDTTSESMSNLTFPLNWDEVFTHVGFPAYFKPYSGGGWKHVYRVTSPEEFFAAYRDSGQHVMTLQEEIVFDEYFRCYAIGRKHVHVMRYDPRQPHAHRYVQEAPPVEPTLLNRLVNDCLKLVTALGYDFDTLEFAVRDEIPYAIDFLNPAPDADPASVGADNFEWVLEHAADWLIERVTQGVTPPKRSHWQEFLAGPPPAKPSPARGSVRRTPPGPGGPVRRAPTTRSKG